MAYLHHLTVGNKRKATALDSWLNIKRGGITQIAGGGEAMIVKGASSL